MITKLIITVLSFLAYGGLYYLILPPITLNTVGGAIFIALGIIMIVLLIAMWATDFDNIFNTLMGCSIGIVTIFIIGGLIGSGLFNSSTWYSQIGEVHENSFSEDIIEVDTSQIPVVDIELATKLADKKLGEDLALGSQQKVGTFTNKQAINGKLYYAAPLEHIGFFKYMSNNSGTVGYMLVSATNPNDVKLIKDINGESLHLKYLKSAFFGNDLIRHVRFSGFATKCLSDEITFEIDENGRPYYIIPTYKNTTLWGAPETDGVIICDVQTGECKWEPVNSVDPFVDIVYPEYIIKNQISNWGKYVHGCFNFSDKDKLSVTEHITTVYNEGNCYYYTGMSSVGADDGTVGFILVNARTKETKLYRMIGATEAAAMRSAEGKVQNMGYVATTPIPINVSGIPTYFLTLKDNEGLVKAYAMVNIIDYSIVESGTNIIETKRKYINSVNDSGTSIDFGKDTFGYSSDGIIKRITANVENGNTYYYMLLDNDKIYLASYMVSDELPLTREGDLVKVSYIDDSNSIINIVSFDNLDISGNISESQIKTNEEKEQHNIINSEKNNVITVNPEENQETWNNLSEEEKAKILNSIENKK